MQYELLSARRFAHASFTAAVAAQFHADVPVAPVILDQQGQASADAALRAFTLTPPGLVAGVVRAAAKAEGVAVPTGRPRPTGCCSSGGAAGGAASGAACGVSSVPGACAKEVCSNPEVRRAAAIPEACPFHGATDTTIRRLVTWIAVTKVAFSGRTPVHIKCIALSKHAAQAFEAHTLSGGNEPGVASGAEAVVAPLAPPLPPPSLPSPSSAPLPTHGCMVTGLDTDAFVAFSEGSAVSDGGVEGGLGEPRVPMGPLGVPLWVHGAPAVPAALDPPAARLGACAPFVPECTPVMSGCCCSNATSVEAREFDLRDGIGNLQYMIPGMPQRVVMDVYPAAPPLRGFGRVLWATPVKCGPASVPLAALLDPAGLHVGCLAGFCQPALAADPKKVAAMWNQLFLAMQVADGGVRTVPASDACAVSGKGPVATKRGPPFLVLLNSLAPALRTHRRAWEKAGLVHVHQFIAMLAGTSDMGNHQMRRAMVRLAAAGLPPLLIRAELELAFPNSQMHRTDAAEALVRLCETYPRTYGLTADLGRFEPTQDFVASPDAFLQTGSQTGPSVLATMRAARRDHAAPCSVFPLTNQLASALWAVHGALWVAQVGAAFDADVEGPPRLLERVVSRRAAASVVTADGNSAGAVVLDWPFAEPVVTAVQAVAAAAEGRQIQRVVVHSLDALRGCVDATLAATVVPGDLVVLLACDTSLATRAGLDRGTSCPADAVAALQEVSPRQRLVLVVLDAHRLCATLLKQLLVVLSGSGDTPAAGAGTGVGGVLLPPRRMVLMGNPFASPVLCGVSVGSPPTSSCAPLLAWDRIPPVQMQWKEQPMALPRAVPLASLVARFDPHCTLPLPVHTQCFDSYRLGVVLAQVRASGFKASQQLAKFKQAVAEAAQLLFFVYPATTAEGLARFVGLASSAWTAAWPTTVRAHGLCPMPASAKRRLVPSHLAPAPSLWRPRQRRRCAPLSDDDDEDCDIRPRGRDSDDSDHSQGDGDDDGNDDDDDDDEGSCASSTFDNDSCCVDTTRGWGSDDDGSDKGAREVDSEGGSRVPSASRWEPAVHASMVHLSETGFPVWLDAHTALTNYMASAPVGPSPTFVVFTPQDAVHVDHLLRLKRTATASMWPTRHGVWVGDAVWAGSVGSPAVVQHLGPDTVDIQLGSGRQLAVHPRTLVPQRVVLPHELFAAVECLVIVLPLDPTAAAYANRQTLLRALQYVTDTGVVVVLAADMASALAAFRSETPPATTYANFAMRLVEDACH